MTSRRLVDPSGRFFDKREDALRGRDICRDEDERTRYSVYALHRRAAGASGLCSYVSEVLGTDEDVPVVVAGD